MAANGVNKYLWVKTILSLQFLIPILVLYLFSGCSDVHSSHDSSMTDVRIISFESVNKPLVSTAKGNIIARICIDFNKSGKNRSVRKLILSFSGNSHLSDIDFMRLRCGTDSIGRTIIDSLANSTVWHQQMIIKGKYNLQKGKNWLILVANIRENVNLLNVLEIEKTDIILDGNEIITVSDKASPRYRYALVLRASGQDNCDTYRIPGIVTTNKGTLVAVYDVRYNGSKDLQEDIDIGMSRSNDGGQKWEPMRVIIDMGEYGGYPQNMNGVGDPCILYDNINGTIWVAALWMNGGSPDRMAWWDSKPGMIPGETGQFILVKSTDDGVTWSDPVNITSQVKRPEWQLLLQGPGRGIVMKDGTLVFPAQYKANTGEKALDGGFYTSFSTIVYSKDGGNKWEIGNGAKSNTTEAQVVELPDGSLMLNMRDDRNRTEKGPANGRAVSVTADLGKKWSTHPSSNSLLPEPNCMASIISHDVFLKGTKKRVLFFSNPDHTSERKNMTIKASLDNGNSWPEEFKILLNSAPGYGYSCLTMINDSIIGIVYEGVKDLYFQKLPVRDFFGY